MRKMQAELRLTDFVHMDPEMGPLDENVVDIGDVERDTIEIYCLECGTHSSIEEGDDECPQCGSADLDVA